MFKRPVLLKAIISLVAVILIIAIWRGIGNAPTKIISTNQPAATVNQAKNPLSAELPTINCTGTLFTGGRQFDCYADYYDSLVKKAGAPQAMLDLKTRYNFDPYAKSQCHQLTHAIGRAAGAKYPSISEAYIRGDSTCWSGYYHGVMETIIKQVGRANITPLVLQNICKELRDKSPYSFDHYNCVHGIGHGLMYLSENELFDSLTVCEDYRDPWEQSSCVSGIFMENIIADGTDHFTKYLKPEDTVYPCDAVADKHRLPCFLMQTSYMLKINGYDDAGFRKTFATCAGVETKYRSICYQSLGRDASGSTISDIAGTKRLCLLGKDFEEQSNCVIGAAKDFISYYHSDLQAKNFCGSLPPDLQTVCQSTAADYYKLF